MPNVHITYLTFLALLHIEVEGLETVDQLVYVLVGLVGQEDALHGQVVRID